MPARRHTTSRRARRQEEAAAERLGGRRVPGSGAGWVTKNDVKTDDLSVEMKYTERGSFTIKRAALEDAEKNALLDSGREFAFVIGFGKVVGQGAFRIEREYVLVPREYFERLRSTSGNPE